MLLVTDRDKKPKPCANVLNSLINLSVCLEFWYQMILPPHFDKSKKYPLLIEV